MEPIRTVTGVVAPLDRIDVDTDQLMPKQFLKRIERTGYGPYLFYDWRYLPTGRPSDEILPASALTPNPAFELNAPSYASASILATGRNFGCGSSREHAPWGLAEYGFRVVIAPSFADIFNNNCLQNGILTVVLPEEQVQAIIRKAQEQPGYQLTVDLEAQQVRDGSGLSLHFDIDPFRKFRLLNGLDDIGLTLQHEDKIASYEQRRPAYLTLGQ